MELKDTVSLMLSGDYKDRLKAEYQQLAIRYKKLNTMLMRWDTGALSKVPGWPREYYDHQIKAMREYMNLLEDRAQHEGVHM